MSTANFLEKLAEPNQEDLGKVFTQFVKETVNESANELHLEKEEKDEIVKQVDQVVAKVKEQRIKGEDPKAFLKGYRESTLPTGTKIMSLVRIIDRSHLLAQEKSNAYLILRRFARAVVNRYIPENVAIQTINDLTRGQNIKAEALDSIRISDRDIRTWLSKVERQLMGVPRGSENELKISDEIIKVLGRS